MARVHDLSAPVQPVLFLDYDGVLWTAKVHLVQGRPVLRARGEPFMWAPLLDEVVSAHPQVRIVPRTSWARELGFARARNSLLASLASRVIGATWHSDMGRIDGESMGRVT